MDKASYLYVDHYGNLIRLPAQISPYQTTRSCKAAGLYKIASALPTA
jgi:hypothetical protein